MNISGINSSNSFAFPSIDKDETATPTALSHDVVSLSAPNLLADDEVDALRLAAEHELLVTLEENATIGGGGSEVARVLNEAGSRVRVLQLGLPDRFVDHGDQAQLLVESGLDAASVLDKIKRAYQVNS